MERSQVKRAYENEVDQDPPSSRVSWPLPLGTLWSSRLSSSLYTLAVPVHKGRSTAIQSLYWSFQSLESAGRALVRPLTRCLPDKLTPTGPADRLIFRQNGVPW